MKAAQLSRILKVRSSLLEPQEVKEDSALKSTNQRIISKLSSMQGSVLLPKKMTLNDKLTIYNQFTQKENLLQKLDRDSILNGENSSLYWNEYSKTISRSKSLATRIDSLDSDSLLLNGCAKRQNANSWFDRERKLSPEQELVEDILSILHCFSSRLYGRSKVL